MKPLLVLAALLLVVGCGDDAPELATQEQACAQAEQVTDGYRDALGGATSPADAKDVIDGAISGLREIETGEPVAARIDDLAGALTDLLESVQKGAPPAELQPRAAALGQATTALARACGRDGS